MYEKFLYEIILYLSVSCTSEELACCFQPPIERDFGVDLNNNCTCESGADCYVKHWRHYIVQKWVFIGQPPLGMTCPLSPFDSLWRLKPWTLSFKFPRTKNWPGRIFQSLKRWKFVKDNTHIVRGEISRQEFSRKYCGEKVGALIKIIIGKK